MGTLFFLVQFLQDVQRYSAFEAGLRTLPASVGIFAVAPFAGRLTARRGPRLPIVLGAMSCTGSLVLLLGLSPDTSYAILGWQMGLFGIGCGLMISPLAAAVLSATPQDRSGLGSSILNTGRQVGITLGVAALGAFILQQFPGNIVSQLTQAGVPGAMSATIAKRIAVAGADASQVSSLGHLPLSPAVLHQTISQAFVDTLKGTFLISAFSLLTVALLVTFLLRQKQPATRTSAEAGNIEPLSTLP